MKKTLILLCLVAWVMTFQAQNLLPEKWKFKTGDDPNWSSPAFDDSGWAEITAGLNWEAQGYNGYDGFAWYRASFIIPAHLEETAKKYGGLNLLLGRIDDVDYTYINGRLADNKGKLPPDYETAWNVDRVYRVPAGWINWGGPNTIAVRVFDLLGGGGIYAGPVQFSVRGLGDFVEMAPVFNEADHILQVTDKPAITLEFINKSRKTIDGNVIFSVFSDFGEEITKSEQALNMEGKGSYPVDILLPDFKPGFFRVKAEFTGELAYKSSDFAFGYEPEKIISPPDPRPDFDQYWDAAKKELAAVDPKFTMTRIDLLSTKKRHVYLVEMRSLGNVLIRGWYSVPAKPGKYPAIMQVPGYSGNMMPEFVDYGEDIIGFGLNIRGHGNSQDDFNPGFPGFLFAGIESKETYVYRGAYMDCLRGIDFLFSRPEVDTSRVAVEGGSQGGALTFATAALDNTRIKVCAPLVPFLSDFEDYFKLAAWPSNEFYEYVEKDLKMNWKDVYTTLSYIDIKNLAGRIRCPLLMGVGLVDDVCPPHINFAAYNQVTGEKEYIVYPYAGHGLPEDYYERRMEFLKKHLLGGSVK